MNVEFLVLPNGRCPVEEFLEELDDKSLAKVYRLIEILKKQGSLPFPHARKMTGLKGLWELRILSKGMAVLCLLGEKQDCACFRLYQKIAGNTKKRN